MTTSQRHHIRQKSNNHFCRPVFSVSLPSQNLLVGQQTKIMGILNVTPDSFSGDGSLKKRLSPFHLAQKLIKEGADIIDVGGESSRPGAKPVSEKDELQRVIPVVSALTKKTTIPVSVDTYKPLVAKEALDHGASIINCIMGANVDKRLLKMVRDYDAAIVLMHMKGRPQTMQKKIFYRDVVKDILTILRRSVENCLEIGIKSDKIIIDPGIGFGKTVSHNLKILNELEEFHQLKKPILLGVSRKSFIGKILNKEVNDRLYGSLAAATFGIFKGVHILRVHDVKQTRDVAMIADGILNAKIA